MHQSATVVFTCIAFISNLIFTNASNIESNKNPCPTVTPVEYFNITAYGHGIWYEYARFPNAIEHMDKCVFADLENNGDEYKLKLRDVGFRSLNNIEATAAYTDSSRNGNLNFSFTYGWPKQIKDLQIMVIAADYDQYVIFYSCFKDEATGLNREVAWIMTRNKKLEESVKSELENVLKRFDFFDSDKFIWIDHSKNSCENY